MSSSSTVRAVALVLLTLASGRVAAQDPRFQPATLTRSTVSQAAAMHFEAGMVEAENVFFDRAAAHFKQAMEASPRWGIARVLHAQYAPAMTRDQRIQEMNQGVIDAAAGSTQELLAALTYRERFVNGAVAARPITHALAELVPGDPRFAMLDALRGGLTPQERAPALRQVATRFPQFGPAYNLLAYDLWRAGDQAGALQAAETQIRLTPNHPNPHDTYAELLQWAGRLDEARTHYQHAVEKAPDYVAAYIGLADVDQLQGRGAHARDVLNGAMPKFTDPVAVADLRAAVANSFLADGQLAEAQGVLGALARDAAARGDRSAATDLHVRMAMADALLGRGDQVEAHLTQAAATGTVDDGMAALAYALAGRAAQARAGADRFSARASAAGSEPALQRNARLVNAFTLIAENDCARAAEALGQIEPADMAVALGRSICLERGGNRAEAQAARARALEDREFALDDNMAGMLRGRLMRGR